MIEVEVLQRLATQHQTIALNVAREYCQHLFLSALYQRKAADRMLFKGGTALRIIYGSPRFSEDLDFSGFGIGKAAIEELITDSLTAMERVGLSIEIKEAKLTGGDYLGLLHSRILDYDVGIRLEISLRGRGAPRPEMALIAGDFLPAYTLLHLPQETLVQERLQALLDRAKPRDFYDLYFMLRRGMTTPGHRRFLVDALARLNGVPPELFRELRLFLPRSQHWIARDFRATLERELRQYVKK